jgi:hypothetical protein
MGRDGFLVALTAFPPVFHALAAGLHPRRELTPMFTLGFTVLAFAWPQALPPCPSRLYRPSCPTPV